MVVPKKSSEEMWQTWSLLQMTKVREAEGASIHRKQTSNSISTEKLLLDTKEQTLTSQSVRSNICQRLAINDLHAKDRETECSRTKQNSISLYENLQQF